MAKLRVPLESWLNPFKNSLSGTSSLVRRRTEENNEVERIRPASGAGGRWFESSHPDQYLQGATFPGSHFLFLLRACSGLEVLPK